MNILITGGAGFIGSNLAKRLALANHKVVVIDDLSTGLKENLAKTNIELRIGSILDDDFINSFDYKDYSIIHLAARGSVPRSISNPIATHDINVIGTLKILELAKKNNSYLLFASSSSVYGSNIENPKTERAWTRPISPYGASKLAGEAFVTAYQSSYNLKGIIFRLFNVYGPFQRADHEYAAVIPKFISAALQNRELEIFGDGTQSRDFTFVNDVVDIMKFSIENRMTHISPINLAFGKPISILSIINLMENIMGRKIRVTYLNNRLGDIRHSKNNPKLLRSILGKYNSTPIEIGIQKVIEWMSNLDSF